MSRHNSFERNISDAWNRCSSGGTARPGTNRTMPTSRDRSRQQNEVTYYAPPSVSLDGLQHNPTSYQLSRPGPSTVGPINRFVSTSTIRPPGQRNNFKYQPYSRFDSKLSQSKLKTHKDANNNPKFIPIPKKDVNIEHVKTKYKEENAPVVELSATPRMIFLSGTVDHVIRWAKSLKNCPSSPDFVFFEAVGILENYYSRGMMKLLFVRGNAVGILQGIFYAIDFNLPDFAVGSVVSLTGRMVGSNKMRVEIAAVVSSQDMPGVHKMAFMCQRAVDEITKIED